MEAMTTKEEKLAKAKEALKLCDVCLGLAGREREKIRNIRRGLSAKLKRLRIDEDRYKHHKRVLRKKIKELER